MRRWGLLAVALIVLVAAGAAAAASRQPVGAPAEPPSPSTQYVAQLRAVSAQVEASLREVRALPAVSAATKPTLTAAGTRLAAAAAATRDVLRTYRDARTRYGTAEEWRLAQKLLVDLQAARTTYGQKANVTLPAATAQQRSEAQQLFEAALAVAANQQIVRWTGDQGLADALTAGGIATVKAELRRELERRLRTQAETAIGNATGFAVALNVPLKQQVVLQAQRLATQWLARTVLHVSPQGLVIQLAGAPIVNWATARLQAMLRNSGNAVGRAERTMAQLAAWRREMLLLSPTASLATARSLSAKIERELGRTGFLELDLRRAGKTATLAELLQAQSLTRTALATFRSRFLLGSPMAKADLNAMVDQAKRLLREIEEITRRLGAAQVGSILGDWEAAGGVMRVTATGPSAYVGRLVKPYTFCRSGSVPLGQDEWKLTQTAPNRYTGTVRYYAVSDCHFIGEAKNGTWEYRPATDTLYSCSSSPNPAYPGGGCSDAKRVK